MKINKNSWHYKLVDHFDHDVVRELIYKKNVTLCQYFWSVVGALIKAGIVVAGAAVVVALVGVLLYGLFCALMFLLIPFTGAFMNYKVYDVGLMTVAFITLGSTFLGVMAACNGDMEVVPDWMKSNTTEQEDKQPSLLWSWIKAKKDKVCPLIKLEEK